MDVISEPTASVFFQTFSKVEEPIGLVHTLVPKYKRVHASGGGGLWMGVQLSI